MTAFSARLRFALLGSLALVVLVKNAPAIGAHNWPNWRGIGQNGVAADEDYPLHWSSDSHVAWSAHLPGPGSSTPVVWGQRIFVTCQSDDANALFCFDHKGETVWKQTVGHYREAKHKKASGANPSAATDGQHVVAYFKSGDLACYSVLGELLWQTNLQTRYAEDTLWWDLGTSPVLVDEMVIVACMQSGESYVVAFRLTTGEELWKVDRNLPAPNEATHSYTTPIVQDFAGQKQLLILGADHITSHEVNTGKEIWRVAGLNPNQAPNFRLISSPVCDDGIVYSCYARGAAMLAVRTDGQGDVTKTHVLWNHKGTFADVPTPTVDSDHVYVCTDRGEVHCLEKDTGERLWTKRLKKSRSGYSSSPIRAGSRLYVTSENGTTSVLDLSKQGAVLAENELGEPIVATPVLIDGSVLIRTTDHLICVRDKS